MTEKLINLLNEFIALREALIQFNAINVHTMENLTKINSSIHLVSHSISTIKLERRQFILFVLLYETMNTNI